MYRKTVLDNGVRIITGRLEHSRVVSAGIWVDVGSRDEHDLNNGCAHFVEHMLFKGTARRTARQIAREFDSLGGTANAFTSRETTCYYSTVLDNHLTNLVDLLADLFLNSTFLEEEVERERQVILQEIHMVEDVPEDLVHDSFAPLLWGDHPLGRTILGRPEVVAAMDSGRLHDYVRRSYTPDKIIIAAAGNVDHDEFVSCWQKHFHQNRPLAESGRLLPRTQPVRRKPGHSIIVKPLEQAHLVLGTYGISGAAEERYAFLLLNILLGGNMSSRLFQEIREKRGLAYSVYSYVSSYVDCGSLSVYLGVDKNSVNESMSLVMREINKLSRGEVSEEEVEGTREFVKAGLFLAAENMENIMSRLARNELTFGRHITVEEVVGAIDRVDVPAVACLAHKLFNDAVFSMAALGPVDSGSLNLNVLVP